MARRMHSPATTTQIGEKIAYSVVGFISLILWFTIGFSIIQNPQDPAYVLVAGVIFYFVFFTWLYLLSAIIVGHILAIPVGITLNLIYFTLDILLPPYYVTPQGQILTQGAIATFGASDVVLASFLHLLGVSGPLLFSLTYIVIPGAALFIIAPLVLTNIRLARTLFGA